MSFVFILDDDKALCRSLEIQLKGQGHEVAFTNRIQEGLQNLESLQPDLLLLDLSLPDGSGIDALRSLMQSGFSAPVVMITGQQDMNAAIEAMRLGAFDYIRKPFDIDDILLTLEKAARSARTSRTPVVPNGTECQPRSPEIVGSHKAILEVLKQIGLLSRNRVTVLIEGESGTGKELVARALHEAATPEQPFVPINCSAVVHSLPESELFGYEKGAFTGADKQKMGKLEYAGEGTAFFDEIGDMPIELQAKILRVVQECNFERVGGLKSLPFQARVIAATNRNLEERVRSGQFRQDLYYRLAVAKIKLPPLRERRTDIPALAHHLIARIAEKLDRQVAAVEDRAMQRLVDHEWPGNVRELENTLTRAVALSRNPEVLSDEDVAFSIEGQKARAVGPAELIPLHEVEKRHIEKALITLNWNITHTARALEISPTTLRKKISDFDLKRA